MINRRHAIRAALAFAAVPACWLLSSAAAHAQQAFQRFIPLLVDLQGWKGGKADGMAMEMPGNSLVTVTREYERGDSRLTAQIVVGPPAQGALAAIGQAVKIETSDSRMSSSAIDGFRVMRTFTVSNKSGAVLVALGTSALFNLQFNDVAEDEALALAKRFDWKTIQAALPK